MNHVEITVSDEELQKIVVDLANEMGVELAEAPEHGCYNCRWYTFWYSTCDHPDRSGTGFRNEDDYCENWEGEPK